MQFELCKSRWYCYDFLCEKCQNRLFSWIQRRKNFEKLSFFCIYKGVTSKRWLWEAAVFQTSCRLCVGHAWVGARHFSEAGMSCDMNYCDSSVKACRHVSQSQRIPFHASFPLRENPGSSISHSWSGKRWQIPLCISRKVGWPPEGSHFTTRWRDPSRAHVPTTATDRQEVQV